MGVEGWGLGTLGLLYVGLVLYLHILPSPLVCAPPPNMRLPPQENTLTPLSSPQRCPASTFGAPTMAPSSWPPPWQKQHPQGDELARLWQLCAPAPLHAAPPHPLPPPPVTPQVRRLNIWGPDRGPLLLIPPGKNSTPWVMNWLGFGDFNADTGQATCWGTYYPPASGSQPAGFPIDEERRWAEGYSAIVIPRRFLGGAWRLRRADGKPVELSKIRMIEYSDQVNFI